MGELILVVIVAIAVLLLLLTQIVEIPKEKVPLDVVAPGIINPDKVPPI